MRNDLIEDLESGSLSYTIIGEFLSDLKKKFGREDNKTIKVAELKKVEQGGKIIEDLYKNLEEQQEKVSIKGGYWWKSSKKE